MRLQKYMAMCGVAARRKCEEIILSGRVSVNGEVITQMGVQVEEGDRVELDGQLIMPEEMLRYIIYHKPAGEVTTVSDEKGRETVMDRFRDFEQRLYPVGRLDMYSEGLLLLTYDGELTNILTHPKHDVAKVYLVRVKGVVDNKILVKLNQPMDIDGYTIKPVKVVKIRDNENSTLLSFELHEGRNRQIRKMCESCELGVLSLKRISEGKLLLGDLPTGKWRYLTRDEVKYLTSIGKENTEE